MKIWSLLLLMCGSSLLVAGRNREQAGDVFRLEGSAGAITVFREQTFPLPMDKLRFPDQGSTPEPLRQEHLDGVGGIPVLIFLVRFQGQWILIDSGTGRVEKEHSWLVGKLQGEGVEPGAVRHIFLTHKHGDHCLGLIGPQGEALFPCAQVHLSQEDAGTAWKNPVNEADKEREEPIVRVGRVYHQKGLWMPFTPQTTRIAGVGIRPLPGHTPGHCGYLLEGEGESVFFWGDIMHVGPLQFPEPRIGITYDTDGEAAVSRRLSLLEKLADTSVLVAGAHLSFPGIGRIRRGMEPESYLWEPVGAFPVH